MQGAGLAMGGEGDKPKVRNAMMVLILTTGLLVVGNILSNGLAVVGGTVAMIGGGLGGLLSLAGLVMFLYFSIVMMFELKKFLQEDFMWWLIFIPCINLYLACLVLPPLVTKAKQKAGAAGEARSILWYFLVLPWALASDLNDIAQAGGGGAVPGLPGPADPLAALGVAGGPLPGAPGAPQPGTPGAPVPGAPAGPMPGAPAGPGPAPGAPGAPPGFGGPPPAG